jgi:hypothetical protein
MQVLTSGCAKLICDHDSVKVSNNYTHASLQTMSKAIDQLVTFAK